MPTFKRALALAALAAMTLLLTACERKITLDKITNVQTVAGPQACFQCHSDSPTDSLHLVAAEQQWEHSKHASGETLNENDSSCKNCHTSEGYVARAGTCTSFTAADQTSTISNPTSIHCFTCHAPHTNGDFRLRWTCTTTLQNGVTYDLKEGNLCASCHQSRRNINTYIAAKPARTTLSTRWGPHHGPQGDMLIGSNGYQYAGFTYEQTNHRGATANGCIDCHMKTTSQNVVGGHSWNMAYDLNGSEVLNTAACEGCHAEVTDDFSQVTLGGTSVQDSVVTLLGTLRGKLVTAGLLNDTGANADLPKAVATNADSAGAVWNYLIVEGDRSEGVHNAKYIIGLLNSAIQYLDGTLPQPAPPATVAVLRRQ